MLSGLRGNFPLAESADWPFSKIAVALRRDRSALSMDLHQRIPFSVGQGRLGQIADPPIVSRGGTQTA